MKSPTVIQDAIVREIQESGDAFDQFNYLLEKGAQLPDMPEDRKVASVLVKDCQSQVWLYLHNEAGRPVIEADSDTLMIRGTIQILKEMFDGQAPRDVADCVVDFIDRTELAYAFDSKRVVGQAAIVRRIKDFAAKLCEGNAP